MIRHRQTVTFSSPGVRNGRVGLSGQPCGQGLLPVSVLRELPSEPSVARQASAVASA
ncbi:MAG: hypothetical protein NC388_08180 [Clostridium sp.]|nr:hypothetical protein [Clostridium sp.]